jgi:UV excision repair protein RAD23
VPEQQEAPAAAAAVPPASGQPVNPAQAPQSARPAVPSSGPNASPLNLFPQVLFLLPSIHPPLPSSFFSNPVLLYLQGLTNASSNDGGGNFDALRNNPQFQSLLSLVQANPQILQVFHATCSFSL